MWLGIAGAYLFCLFLAVLHLWPVDCHLPSSHSTPSSKVDLHCDLAEYCVHDTIPVCGKMGDEKKTFLDMCDMIEYVCDTNKMFVHVDDEPDCPPPPPEDLF